MSRVPTIPHLFLVMFLAIAFTPTGRAEAQTEEPAAGTEALDATPEEVGRRAAEILTRLETLVLEHRDYEGRLESASAEDSLVLRLQIADAEDRFMTTLEELADVARSAAAGEASDELRERAEIVFSVTTASIWEIIDGLRREIDVLRAKRLGTAPGDRPAHEDRIVLLMGRLDRIYSYGGGHLANLATIGQDTTEARMVFAELLSGRANELSGRLRLATLRINELGLRLKDTPDDADAGALLTANHKALEANARSQDLVLDLMDDLQLPTSEYRAQLITTTQDIASGLLDARTTMTLLARGWRSLSGWVVGKGPTWLIKIVIFLIIVFGGRLVARLVQRAVDRSMTRANLNISKLLHRMIVNASRNAVMALAVVFALAELGISLGPLLAGFGVVGFILGFAMQDSLSNLAAGMMILINRPYDVGDMVEIAGVFGKVEHMSMVSTSILTIDNQMLVVPNSRIWGDVIKNVTDQQIRRVDLVFGISYGDDIPQAERVLGQILADNEMVLDDPEPMVRLHTLNESSVDFVVRPWVKTEDYWNVHWDVTRAVKMRFDEEGISIPFPQRDVHMIAEQPAVPVEQEADMEYPSVAARDPDEPAGNEG